MGVTLTDVLLFGKAQSDDVDKATFVIYRRNILRWSALGGYLDIIVKGVSPLSLPDAIANSLSYVKAFGGTEQRNLPDNYIERQFIYMMDGSYLLTDIVPASAGKVEFDFATTTLSPQVVTYLGSRTDTSAGDGLRLGHNGSNKWLIYGFQQNGGFTSSESALPNTRYKFVYNNGVATITSGGTTVDSNTFTSLTEIDKPLALNAYNYTTVSGNIEGIYLYSFKMWNAQGELVADYVPAVQKGTVPVVGFYDTVSKTFKTATAGTFAAGGEAVPTPDTPMDIVSNNGVLKARHQSGLPLGYTALEYIESTGTQYIDTGVSGNATIKITAQASTIKGSSQALLSSTSGASGGTWFGEFTTNQKWGIGSGAGLTTIDPTTKMTAEIAFDGSGCRGTVNGESITRSATITQGGWTIMATSQLNYPFSGKVWGCQITQSGTLVRNFVPCKNASNVVGMYDLVNGVFYQNAGTGTFTAGSAVSDPIEIYADGLQETINVHTKNLFDEQWNRNTGVSTQTATWGQVVTASGWSTSGLVPVQAGRQYTVSYNTTVQLYVFYYESDGTMQQSYDTVSSTKKTFTVPSGATHIRLQVNKNTEAQIAELESQLETGATATDYEPYYNGGTATAEMLLKIDTYQDVQSIIDGAVTRNVGVKVLDGTEDWGDYATANGYNLAISDMARQNYGIGLCSHLKRLTSVWEEGVRFGASNSTIYVCQVTLKYPNVTAFKQWLADQYAAGTPVIIVYLLATATTESVTGQTLQVQDGDNIVEITQASLNNLELEAEYQAAVSLTIQEVQDANLDPNVQVTIN